MEGGTLRQSQDTRCFSLKGQKNMEISHWMIEQMERIEETGDFGFEYKKLTARLNPVSNRSRSRSGHGEMRLKMKSLVLSLSKSDKLLQPRCRPELRRSTLQSTRTVVLCVHAVAPQALVCNAVDDVIAPGYHSSRCLFREVKFQLYQSASR